MAIRFTDTDKWNDAWFSSLSAKGKLLFLFLCDNCNIAGIIEINKQFWAMYTSLTVADINKAMDEIKKCYILSSDGECLFVRNFLKHQRNYPINLNNKAHVKITEIYESYKYKFNNESLDEIIERGIGGGSEGDRTPSGNSIGKGIDNIINDIPTPRARESKEDKLKKKEDAFKKTIEPYVEKYGRDLCNEFFLYWTEPNKTKTKLRFEMQDTWSIGRRLGTWAKNNDKFGNGRKQQKSDNESLAKGVAAGIARAKYERDKHLQ